MRGHIRRHGSGYEYIVDVGLAQAQRCAACHKRIWLERLPKRSCPACGGTLLETEERRRLTKAGFASRKEAERALARVCVSVQEHTFVAETTLTLSAYLLGQWLPAAKGTVRETTYSGYASHCRRYLVPRLGTTKLAQLSAPQINACYGLLAQEGRLQQPGALAPATVRRIHATLHRALGDAVRWGVLALNPADGADPPQARSGERKVPAWSAEQLAAFLTHVRDDRLYGLWHFLAMTGCRRGEALGLAWQDLDIERGMVSIHRALVPVDGKAILCEPKTARGRRTIALDGLTLAVLRAHACRQADESRAKGWSDTGYVFSLPDGRPLCPQHVSRAFERHLRRGGLPRIRLHDLRHTYASLALGSGVNPRIVSGRLGHSSVAFTLDVYAHVLPQQDRDAAEAIASLVRLPG